MYSNHFLRPAETVRSDTSRKPCSGYKLKEMTGSGIFVGDADDGVSESGSANLINKTGVRIYQVFYQL